MAKDIPLFKKLFEQSKPLQNELVGVRRHLHKHPETGWNEHETAAYIQQQLKNKGFEFINGLAGTGFYTEIEGDYPGPTIAWRADMDALPIQDEKTVSYHSQNSGVSHMCGHDVHSTVALGIAELLRQHTEKINGRIRIFWQPAEETQPSGAPSMIKDGVLRNVRSVFAMHCDPNTESGQISFCNGAETAAFDSFTFYVESSSAIHSARPHRGPDCMWISTQIIQHLYHYIGRMFDPLEPSVLSICQFQGGDALNVIPKKVNFGGTFRTVKEEYRHSMRSWLTTLASNMAAQHDVKINVEFGLGAPAVINNEKLYHFARKEVIKSLGKDKFPLRKQSMGGEDFGFYTAETPGLFLRIGTRSNNDTAHPLHSSLFDIDERIIAPTCAFGANLLIKHLNEFESY
jgi:amidohydrolase